MNLVKGIKRIKRSAKKVARELEYPPQVLLAIDKCETETAVIRVLTSSRKGEYDK